MKNSKNDIALSTLFYIEHATITTAIFDNKTVAYDGTAHTITVTGAPENTTVAYTMNNAPFAGATDIGVYNITATITGAAYKEMTLTATLEITKGTFSGITLNSNAVNTIRYDGTPKSIKVTGNLPANTTVTYVYTSPNGSQDTQAINAGIYTVTATVTNGNYETKILTATLTINKAIITGITYADKSVKYDGLIHQMEVIGTIPAGATVTFRTVSGVFNGATNVGSYSIYATVLGGANYEDLKFYKKNSFGQDEERSQNLNIVNQQMGEVTGLTIGDTSGAKVYLNWNQLTNAGSYRVIVYDDAGNRLGDTVVIRESTSQPIPTTFDIRGWVLALRLPKATYDFKVSAIPNSQTATTHGESNPSTATASYYHDRAMLDAPAYVIHENGYIKWAAVAGAQAYDLIIEFFTPNGTIKTKRFEFYDEKKCSVAEILTETGYGAGDYRFSVCAYPLISVGQQTVVDTSRKSNYTVSAVIALS
jgi:hypothetical protein